MIPITFKNKFIQVFDRLLRLITGGHLPVQKLKDVTQNKQEIQHSPGNEMNYQRRVFLKGLAGIPFLAIFPGAFARNRSDKGPDDTSHIKINAEARQIKDLKVKLSQGKLGNLSVSKMILGCNLIGGWSHARDLIYTDTLFRAYNNENKIIETLSLAEQAGINTTMMVTQYYPVFNKYKNNYNGKIQSICQAMLPEKDLLSDINLAISSGATALYIQGGEGDKYISSGRFDLIFKAIEFIKKQGFLAGMGAHSLETIKVCEEKGIGADFYVKTLHHDRYWSAHPEENREEYSIINEYSPDHNKYHDNMWDLFPSRTIEYMKTVHKPWIAFKVLAAGAILPDEGFRYAFENGADFIAVGMFDFQIIDDTNIANQVLSTLGKREREWYS